MFRTKLQQKMVDAGISGDIPAHSEDVNRMAIHRMLELDPYFAFSIRAIAEAVGGGLAEPEVTKVVAESLGISPERFKKKGAGYINPDTTIAQMGQMLDAIDRAIADNQLIILATGHPGSLLNFYFRLQDYILRREGKLLTLDESLPVGRYLWLDSVQHVLAVSDMGSLLHTHGAGPMEQLLHKLAKAKIGLVVSDHGFAGAAINAGLKTAALHDVDDPGIPVARHLGRDVISVPMNDNQLNLKTDGALQALINSRS